MGAPGLDSAIFVELADEIGEVAARLLCEKLGGTYLYIPGKPKPDHPVSLLLGEELAARLGRRFKGESVLIPRGRRTGDRARVVELRKTTSLSAKQIALATGYHVRQVCRILDEEMKSRQPDLF